MTLNKTLLDELDPDVGAESIMVDLEADVAADVEAFDGDADEGSKPGRAYSAYRGAVAAAAIRFAEAVLARLPRQALDLVAAEAEEYANLRREIEIDEDSGPPPHSGFEDAMGSEGS